MTMVAGIAAYLHQNPVEKGNIYLVFQPAEEIGEGAARINKGLKQLDIQLDHLFGLHNIVGYPKGQVLTKTGTFAAASRGMVIKLFGRTSHAAEPEYGISPVIAMAEITTKMTIAHITNPFSDLTLATVIHSELGEIAFGTSPGYGEVRITLRAMKDADMQKLIDFAENLVDEQAKKEQLEYEISYTEIFPSTENTEEAFEIMKAATEFTEVDFKQLDKPFKWSEDFGQYKLQMKTGFFGIGAGVDTPHLHDEYYDFPDDIILSGIKMYVGLIKYFKLD
jgi:amidohydrolase